MAGWQTISGQVCIDSQDTMNASSPIVSRTSLIIASACILAHDVLGVLAFVPQTPSNFNFDATFNCAGATATTPHACDARFSSHARRDTNRPMRVDSLGEQSADSKISAKPNDSSATGVTLKLAFDSSPSCWGIADLSATKSERFTSPQSLDMVHRLRAVSDCVLVGKGTVVADDCTLTVRRGYETSILEKLGRNQPTRVVLDSYLELIRDHMDPNCEASYKMLEDGLPVILYHLGTVEFREDLEDFLKDRPAITLVDASKLPSKGDDTKATTIQGGSLQTFAIQATPAATSILPQLVVQNLHSRGIHHIMVEGGAATALSFLRAGVVDRAIIVKASLQFQEPLDSNINENVLEKDGGLKQLGTSDDQGDMFGGDSLMYWVRDDGKEKWPADNVTEWP